jgi:hypothetical protein
VYELGVGLLSLILMEGSFWGGLTVQQYLRETHRSRESIDSIRVVITLLVTFAAVVLGLLISAFQTRFTNAEAGIRAYSIDIVELDRPLRDYGPSLDPLRADLILYTKSAIADLWPDEPEPPGNYRRYPVTESSAESTELGQVLNRIDMAVRHLQPEDAFHASLAAGLEGRIARLLDQRWMLIANIRPSLSWPIVVIMVFWLVIIFVIAGLTSQRNLVMSLVATIAAVSLASSIFLALELDTPMTGFIRVPSAPLRDALVHISQPPLPSGAQ